MTDAAALLDAAQVAKEVAMLVALVLIECDGDPDAAQAMLVSFEGLAPPESINELDAVPLAAQAIREAVALRG